MSHLFVSTFELRLSGICTPLRVIDGNTNEVLQMLYILLTDKIHFQDLSDKNKFQKAKE